MSILLYKKGSVDARLAAILLLEYKKSITWHSDLEYSTGIFELLEDIPTGGKLYILGLTMKPSEVALLSKAFDVIVINTTDNRSISLHIWKSILGDKSVSPLVSKIENESLNAGLSLLTFEELSEAVHAQKHMSDIYAIELIAYGAAVRANHLRMVSSLIDCGFKFKVVEEEGLLMNISKMHIEPCWNLICKSINIMVSYTDKGLIRLWSIRTALEKVDVGDLARRHGGDGTTNEAGFSTRVPMNPMDTLTKIKIDIEKQLRGT